MTIARDRHLPPSKPYRFSAVVPSGETVIAFEGRLDSWNGVIVYGQSDKDLIIHVDSGTEFGGSIIYSATRMMLLRAGTPGDRFPVESAAEWIRVRLTNPGLAAAEEVRVATYLATVGMIPKVEKPTITLWDEYVIPAASGQHYSPVIDLSGTMTARFFIRRLNGATGPSIQAGAAIQVSPDGELWHDEKSLFIGGNQANNDTTTSHGITFDYKYARIRCGGNTGQPITVWAKANLAHY